MTGRSKTKDFVSHYKCKESCPSSNSVGQACWSKHINAKRTEALILEGVKAVVQHPNATEIACQAYHAVLHSEFSDQEYQNIKRQLSDLTAEEIATAKAQI